MTNRLRVGYVPLTDAALLHVAKAQHFAAARGVEIELVADSSWANIRDKLVAGHFDAAHMLAPAAIAVSLGIDQVEAPLVAPVALGLNGNAITVSKALFQPCGKKRKARLPILAPPPRRSPGLWQGAAKQGKHR